MLTRRQFLESGCALAATSGAASLFAATLAEGPDEGPGYRALVCVALGGGADSFNMLVPTGASAHRDYADRRGDLALKQDELLPLGGNNHEGQSYGLHYGLHEVHELYAAGEVALLANAGPLQSPHERPGDTHLPDLSHSGLISHWHHGATNPQSTSGWAGRVADAMGDCGWPGQLPINISMSGRNVMQFGAGSMAANLQNSPYRHCSRLQAGVDFSYLNEQLAKRAIDTGRPGSIQRRLRRLEEVEAESKLIIDDAIASTQEFKKQFVSDPFSKDLEQVAKIIAARDRLGVRRQIFFVHFDGWDHHHQLLENQAVLLPMLSRGLAAFRDALIENDAYDDVTLFTISDFGRCLESNGNGSDHGWGGHHIVMGGAVRGGNIYGHYPSLAKGNPLDIGSGSFVPTTSMDEYLAEMALWFGTRTSDISYVLPDISRFWSAGNRTPPLGMLA